jgi:pyruvate kinase
MMELRGREIRTSEVVE